ncbi:CcdB family protein [Azospirillum thermophilum]|uniref:CcdB family protein n=1 Tax=Azospirillum thermophilum TaxID=2202148 RepID=UPI0011B518B3|nr:CcdB family protein [Azospirillum thermophilum]
MSLNEDLLANKPPAAAYDPTAMPPITVSGETFFLDILGILNVSVDRLGEVVASAKEDQDAIIKALDWLVRTGPSTLG